MSKSLSETPSMEELTNHWTDYAATRLVGRTIKEVRYLTNEEAKGMMWYSRPIAIFFDDGSYIFISKDDEGNDGGAVFGTDAQGDDFILPVLRTN